MMSWKGSLGRRKFYSILLASSIEMIVGILMSLIDTGVTGHILGETGLSVMNLIGPITGITVFTEGVFSVGTSIVYASYKGDFHQDQANAAFTAGLINSICMGTATSLILLIVVPPYLSYMGVSSQLRRMVHEFLFFLYPQLALAPAYQLLCQMVITDDGEMIGTISNIVETVSNLVLSILLGMRMGIMGIGLGTLISTLAGLGIVLVHFTTKRNSLRIRRKYDRSDLKKMVMLGANDSSMFFLLPILNFVTIKFVILRFGEFHLPLLTIIYSIFELTVIFEATGEAMRPIMPIYMGDHNNTAIKNILKYSQAVNLERALFFFLTLVIAGSYIPIAFDITDPVLLEECKYALWIYALAAPGLAIVTNFNSYYINTGKPFLAALESVLNNLLCILVLAIPFGMLFGTQGMMLGYALAPYLTIAILFAYIVLRYGRDRFPDLLEPADNILLNRTITLGEEEIMQLVYDAHVILENNHTDKKTEHSLELVLEEILLLILEKNRGEEPRKKQKKIYAEVCIRTGQKGTDLSVWDSGEIFDATDVDNEVVSFLDYITARILSLQHERKHMVATSFNKNFFHFD